MAACSSLRQSYFDMLARLHAEGGNAILIADEEDIDRLKIALLIKELIDINSPQQALRLSNFQIGRQLIFPSIVDGDERSASRKFYLIDDRTAECFYQTEFYYSAFKERFNMAIEQASKVLDQAEREAEGQVPAKGQKP